MTKTIVPVVFQNSFGAVCRLSVAKFELPTQAREAHDAPGWTFWNPIDQPIVQSVVCSVEVTRTAC